MRCLNAMFDSAGSAAGATKTFRCWAEGLFVLAMLGYIVGAWEPATVVAHRYQESNDGRQFKGRRV